LEIVESTSISCKYILNIASKFQCQQDVCPDPLASRSQIHVVFSLIALIFGRVLHSLPDDGFVDVENPLNGICVLLMGGLEDSSLIARGQHLSRGEEKGSVITKTPRLTLSGRDANCTSWSVGHTSVES
jgi:hypothetical protein